MNHQKVFLVDINKKRIQTDQENRRKVAGKEDEKAYALNETSRLGRLEGTILSYQPTSQ